MKRVLLTIGAIVFRSGRSPSTHWVALYATLRFAHRWRGFRLRQGSAETSRGSYASCVTYLGGKPPVYRISPLAGFSHSPRFMRGIHIHTGRIRPAKSRVPEGRHRVGRGLAPCIAIKNKPEPRQPRRSAGWHNAPHHTYAPLYAAPQMRGSHLAAAQAAGNIPHCAFFIVYCAFPCSRRRKPPSSPRHYARRAFFTKGGLVVPHCWVSIYPL